MSGRREIVSPGYPAVDVDAQRGWDAGAEADSIMDEVLLTPDNSGTGSSVFVKSITPLAPEVPNPPTAPVDTNSNPAILVAPVGLGTAFIKPFRATAATQVSGSPTGIPTLATINPASVGPTQVIPAGMAANYNANTPAELTVAPGDPTNPRIDVMYAVLSRVTSVTGNRQYKDPTSGIVSTQSLTLAADPTLTFAIVQGTPAPSPSVPSLPSDTFTAWYFALANVTIPANFNPATTALGSGGSHISQAWKRGGVNARRVKAYNPASGFLGGSSGITQQTAIFDRWSSDVKVALSVLVSTAGSSNLATLDTTVDWRHRLVRLRMFRPPSQGSGVLYPSPEIVGVAGPPSNSIDSYAFTGAGGTGLWFGGTPAMSLGVDATTGALTLESLHASTDAVNGDSYMIVAEGSPQFVGPNV